jgi:hypothetical protein
MTYLTTFAATADVAFGGPSRPTRDSVLEHLEQELREYDAEIIERGEGFLTFRVPIGERLARSIGPRIGGWGRWSPFDYVSSGTLSVAAAPEGITVSGEVQSSQWFFTPAVVLAIRAGTLLPFHGAPARTLLGLLVGAASAAVFLILSEWQFRSWLQRLVSEISS